MHKQQDEIKVSKKKKRQTKERTFKMQTQMLLKQIYLQHSVKWQNEISTRALRTNNIKPLFRYPTLLSHYV